MVTDAVGCGTWQLHLRDINEHFTSVIAIYVLISIALYYFGIHDTYFVFF